MTAEIPLLLNPLAGRRATATLERDAAARGLRLVRTADALDLGRRLRDLVDAGAERVAVAGGDGTVHDAVQVLAGGDTALAIVPLGTGNDAARALGVPLDTRRALDRVREGNVRRIDLGRADGRRFVATFGLGVDTDTNRLAEALRRRGVPRGPWLYPLAAIAALARFSPLPVSLRLDDGPPDRRRVTLVALANGPCYGGGMRVAPDARIDDGLLDVVVVRAASLPRLLPLLAGVYAGRHVRSPLVEVSRAARVEIEAPPGRAVQMDGEAIVGDRPVHRVDVERAALPVVA